MTNSIRRNTPIFQRTRELLITKDYVKLAELCQSDKKYFKALKFAVYDVEESISRPAVEATAQLMQNWWRQCQQEKVRTYIETLFWSLNDESGGIGWNSPQQIAEIVVLIPELVDPYAGILISRCIDEPLLLENMLWSVGRMGKLANNSVNFFAEDLFEIVDQKESQIMGVAAWAMGEVGFAPSAAFLESVKTKNEMARIYINGEFVQRSVNDWATEALAKLPSTQNS